MKVLVLSSLPQDSGCWLRTSYMAKSLEKKCTIELVNPPQKCLPMLMDVIFSTPYYIFKALTTDAHILIGVKPFPNITIPLLLAKLLRKKRIVVDVDDADYLYFKGFPAKLIEWAQKSLPRFFDLVTYHTSLLRDLIIDQFGVKPESLYLLDQGVDLSQFYPREKRSEKNMLFYTGHLNVASELKYILKAVKMVQEQRGVHLIVAGGGPEEATFRKMADKMNVDAKFTGRLSAREVAEKCAISEVCLVYHRETTANAYRCSMKIRECLAMGKKIVCNDYGDLKQFEKFTYQARGDINDFAEKILDVIDGGDSREIQGHNFIKNRYDWDTIGERFYNKLRELLACDSKKACAKGI